MDPVTHMLVGAVVGQAVAGRKLGFAQAACWGAIAAELPDIDVLLPYMAAEDPLDMLVQHRGVTHSLWFPPVVGLLAGLLVSRFTLQPRANPWAWVTLFTAALLSHPLLDVCTHYGTQLLAPFSDRRFALPALPIIEPVYTGIFAIGLAVSILLVRHERARRAVLVCALTLVVSTAYLLYGLKLNSDAVAWARKDLTRRSSDVAVVYAFPTLLQLPYRRVVARTAGEDWVGFVSMAHPCPIVWSHHRRDDTAAIEQLRASYGGRIFEWFAEGLTAAYADDRHVFLADLRYGFLPDVLRSAWRLEAEIGSQPHPLGIARFVQDRGPAASAANVMQLLRAAYPQSCDEPARAFDD
ncbi:MAG TPA: metal-dependent hydrolase [Gammaproteobacteria bacterium]|jgi:inner membrane protein|nr:metal-dependent hydrolase [Gammaproteobacteria bacterium]